MFSIFWKNRKHISDFTFYMKDDKILLYWGIVGSLIIGGAENEERNEECDFLLFGSTV